MAGLPSWGGWSFFQSVVPCLKVGSGLETWQEILILD